MDLRHLRYFVAVAEELHFGRAAQRLHMSQPPLSQQIRRFESELGVLLFERSKRNVKLTPVGQAFYHRAKMILASAQIAIAEVQQLARGEQDTVRLGFMSAVMLLDFPAFLRPFHERFPQVTIVFQQLPSDAQYEALIDGRIDAGFVDLAPREMNPLFRRDRVNAKLALRKRLVAAVPNDHRLAACKSISLRDLSDDAFVMLRRSTFPSFYDKVIAMCQRSGFSPSIVAEAESMPVVVAYTASKVGVSIVPDSAKSLFNTDVCYVDLDLEAHVDIYLITRVEAHSPVIGKLEDIVIDVYQSATTRSGRKPRSRGKGKV